MAGVSAEQTKRIMSFFDLVTAAVKNNVTNVGINDERANNVALALLMDMANSGIGLTFPDPVTEGRIDIEKPKPDTDKPLF